MAQFICAATGFGVRPLISALPANRVGVWTGRCLIAGLMAALGPPLLGTSVERITSGAVRGDWIRAPGVVGARRAIYYIHGSGFAVCSARTHRGLASRLSRASGLPVFVLEYRLAPEHRFPAAADDVQAGYQWLLESGFRPEEVVVAGDSAGGHLILDLLFENARADVGQPAAAVLFSPLLDPTFTLAAAQEQQRRDPMITAKSARALVAHYTREQPDDHPRLHLTVPSGAVLPPLLVQVGGVEMLRGDAEELHRLFTAAGGKCELEIWPGQMHVFQALPLLLPEAKAALSRVSAFLAASLAGAITVGEEGGLSDARTR
ncbi:alpha/beta hydrolase [Nocardia brasiliensis]